MSDYTPQGDEIVTGTMWLSFADEGEIALSWDATGLVAGLKKAQRAAEHFQRTLLLKRLSWHLRLLRARRIGEDFDEALQRIRAVTSLSADEIEAARRRLFAAGGGP